MSINSHFANPQEISLGRSTCMIVRYAAACSAEGIDAPSLLNETLGDIIYRVYLE